MDLSHIPVLDEHAHNLVPLDSSPFVAAFTEGYDPAILEKHARHSLFFRRSLRDLADLLGCDATEESIRSERSRLGLEALTGRCFQAAKLEAILLDDGLLPDQILPLDWHEQFVPVRRLLRIETLAESLLPLATGFDDFLARFRGALDPPPAQVVGFKSIAAYRTGLDIQDVSRARAEAQYRTCAVKPRLTDKTMIDFLAAQSLEIAAKHGMPFQLHTGFGDPDLDLRLANPLHLRPWLEDERFRSVPIVLLHASYPYMREAGFLASVYPQVYLDCGLAVPMLSISGMRGAIRQLLELAPTTKLMYSSDAHLIPELYFLGAKWGRQGLGDVLEGAVADGDLTGKEVEEVATAILNGNARRLYRMPGPA